ncbi:MAG: glycosyltransferase [Tahibacter sp.]
MTELAAMRRHWWTNPLMWRFVPLYLATAAAGLWARFFPGTWQGRDQARVDAPGITVLIPERGTPDVLGATLRAAVVATALLGEPVRILVVVNGAPREDYASLQSEFTQVEWQFHKNPLGYNGAVRAGLRDVRHAWTYLLNSDMRLAENALTELLAYRQPQVFAITSQIFFSDLQRRREETGWSDFHWNAQVPEVYDRDPQAGELARGNLYPGGGSSLCRTELLRSFVQESTDYNPYYWEDADWGIRAWSEGWETLFCPTSHAWHLHRATVKRYYSPVEVDRVIARNALLFDLRHGWSGLRPGDLMHRLAGMDAVSRDDLAGLGLALRVFRSRVATRRARRRGLRFETLATDRYYSPRVHEPPSRPRVLLVSPFALFPPVHGGARRIAELVMRLSAQVDFVLLSDERSLYDAAAEPWFRHLRAVHLVEGRGDKTGEAPLSMDRRMTRHAWPYLRTEVARLLSLYDPDIVQVEFMELAEMAQEPHGRARWVLGLHDVYIGHAGTPAEDDTRQHALLNRYDALITCSTEDAALLQHPHISLIGNGAIDRRPAYRPSTEARRLLFMGPFRYAQNLDGIRDFIDGPWRALRAHFPDLRLCILGGPESAAIAAVDARFSGAGIELHSRFVDPARYLDECTMTINPQRDIRGSSIKLIESLLAGRVCVSTSDGARGFADSCLVGLVVAEDIAAMAEPIASLLGDSIERHRIERSDDHRLDAHTWDATAQRQLALYRQLMSTRP